MRLCWNDWFNGPISNMDPADAERLADMGWQVAGINSGNRDATNADIARAKAIFDDYGLMPGPFGAGVSIWHVDPAKRADNTREMTRALRLAGALGCTAVRYSIGSMHPTDVWRHHPDNHTQKALDQIVDATRELVPVAESEGVMLCPETNCWTIVHNYQRMKEYVQRLDSPMAKVIFDPVNHMNPERVFDSGRWMQCAVSYLGDCIGELHVKDGQVMDSYMVHIEEAPMGEGLLDHAALIEISDMLEPWKTFSLEHINDRERLKPAYDHIMAVSHEIGHTWTDPGLTREKWLTSQNR